MVLLWCCYGAATVVDRLRFLETLAEACEKGESEDGGRQGPAITPGAFLGVEIGTSQITLPVGACRFWSTPHIVLSVAFL